jgi:superfamily I DNA and/or RNA helicase
LQLDNRLCVALSRQRRLLIVVGDLGMTQGPDARESVSALVRLRELCESDLGQVIDA